MGLELRQIQEKQRRQTLIPLYARGADTLWTNRMSQTVGVSALCGQTFGLPRDNVVAGREPGGSNSSHQLITKVGAASVSEALCTED